MKWIFNILAIVSGLGGLLQLYSGVASLPSLLSLVWLFSGLISLIGAYAWSLIGDMWEKQQELEQKISGTVS